jgi:hypothetical protein
MERLFALISLIICARMTYAFYRLDFAKKHYDLTNRLFPSFMVWPKDYKTYLMLGKIVLPLATIISLIFLILG